MKRGYFKEACENILESMKVNQGYELLEGLTRVDKIYTAKLKLGNELMTVRFYNRKNRIEPRKFVEEVGEEVIKRMW